MKNMEKSKNLAKAIMPEAYVVEVYCFEDGWHRFVSFNETHTVATVADGANTINIVNDRTGVSKKYTHTNEYKNMIPVANDIIEYMDSHDDDVYAFSIENGHAYAI